jgi:hypothetical protein
MMTAAVADPTTPGQLPVELFVPTDLIHRRVLGPYEGPTEYAEQKDAAHELATARTTVHPAYHNRPGDCFALIWRAQALDIHPGIALDHLYVNDEGRVGLTAQLMAALLIRAGIVWKTARRDDQVCELRFRRDGSRKWIGSAKWTILEAARAGLTKKWVWSRFPADCLFARALARGCRSFFSDIVLFGYTWDEIRDKESIDTHQDPAPLDPRVAALLDQAATATPDDIRAKLLPAAKRLRALTADTDNGRTVEQALHDAWLRAAALEAARAADIAQLADAPAGHDGPDPADETPLDAAKLPCGCDAAEFTRTGAHRDGCPEATR